VNYPLLYAGARAPEQIKITVQVPADIVPDLATISAVTLSVYRRPQTSNPSTLCEPVARMQEVVPMGGLEGVQPQVWTTTILSRGCGQVRVTHAFVDGNDVDEPGALLIVPTLQITPSGVLRCAPIDVIIVPYLC
jgi:hypothetical protein